MKLTHLAITLISLLPLAACVTETTGRVQSAEQPREAADLNVQLGIGYLRQGDWQSARVKLEKAVALDSGNVIAHRALGLVYRNLGDIDGARGFTMQAREIAEKQEMSKAIEDVLREEKRLEESHLPDVDEVDSYLRDLLRIKYSHDPSRLRRRVT